MNRQGTPFDTSVLLQYCARMKYYTEKIAYNFAFEIELQWVSRIKQSYGNEILGGTMTI